MQSHLPVKRWQRPLNATAELHGAVLSDPDLLHIILASVDRWTQSFPLHTMGVSRRVNKLWMTMGRSLAVRKAYCNIVNWMELPRYYCTHLPPPQVHRRRLLPRGQDCHVEPVQDLLPAALHRDTAAAAAAQGA